MAFLLVCLVVPASFGLAGSLNGLTAGSLVWTFDDAADLTDDVFTTSGNLRDIEVLYKHKNATNVYVYNEQSVYFGSVLGTDYNQLIVTSGDTGQYTTRTTALQIKTALTAAWCIEHKVDTIVVGVNYSSAKALKFVGIASYTEATYAESASYGWAFLGSEGTVTKKCAAEPLVYEDSAREWNATWGYKVTNDWIANVTATRMAYYSFDVSELCQLKADTYLTGVDNQTLMVGLSNSGNTDATSIIPGDSIKFVIEVYGSPVSAVQISDYLVGLLGGGLLLLAIVNTPWVNPTKSQRGGGRR